MNNNLRNRYFAMMVATISACCTASAQDTASELELTPTDTLSANLALPELATHRALPSMHRYAGYRYGGWMPWQLHEGMNISLDMSVFTTLGKRRSSWSGTGFAEGITMAYADNLTDRVSYAVGGYFSNLSWGHNMYREGGVTALLSYQLNEQLSAYAYAQKSLMQPRTIPYPLYDIHDIGDRLGIGMEYKFSPAFTVGVSVETRTVSPHPLLP